MAVALQSAEGTRARAELRAAEAKEVADFLVGLFESADPEQEPGTHTAREFLDIGAARLEAEPLTDVLTRARLLETVAGVYHELRLLEPAARLFEQAIAPREREQGPDHADLMAPLLGLAATRFRAIRYAEAESPLNRVVSIAARHAESDPPELPRGLVLQGNLHLVRGRRRPRRTIFGGLFT